MIERMKIMAVDDNTVNLATIDQELKDTYDVVLMLTGRRAIKYLYQNTVDLILLDVQMPIMDGIETLKEIRSLDEGVTIPVIFLTAKKDAATVLEGSKLGIMDYITKPFDPDDLKERIERCFKRLGRLPMETTELFQRISDISVDLTEGKLKSAISKTEEVLRYQLPEDIKGRVSNAKKKLEMNDLTGAKAMIDRILAVIGKDLEDHMQSMNMPINQSEISARLLYILDDIENFRDTDAVQKLEELMNYDIGDSVKSDVQQAIDFLKNYDDVSAEQKLRELLEELKNNARPVLGSTVAQPEVKAPASGYHFK